LREKEKKKKECVICGEIDGNGVPLDFSKADFHVAPKTD
jgi:hypothetical protein